MPTTYRVNAGVDYPDPRRAGEEKRAEIGDLVDDIPAGSLGWLVEQGVLTPVTDAIRDTPPRVRVSKEDG